MNEFLQRLKERKLVQWALAYVAAAFALIQVLDIVATRFGWPESVERLVIIALAIGFFVVLVLAWYHGERGAQRVSGTELLILALLLTIGGAVAWRLAPSTNARESIAPAAASTAGPVDDKSIAVLPFLNMSDDKENTFFADGISEELLNVLVKVTGFSVASRTSSFAYQGKQVSTAQIAKDLGVRYVLEGSVRKQGDEVRITAQLIDAGKDRHLFSQTYDRKLADIFKVQDEIANNIVDSVRGSVGDATTGKAVSVRADTENLDAYQTFLKARELFVTRRDLPQSVALYEHVVELDPKFARGWEGLAAAYSVMRSWGYTDRDYDVLAEKAAHRALELDPNLSIAWAALGSVEANRMPADLAKSIQMFDHAIEIDPHNSSAVLWRAITWMNLGFFEKAIADTDQGLVLEPHYGHCAMWKALALLVAGERRKGLALYEQGLATGFRPFNEQLFATQAIPSDAWLQWYLFLDAYDAKPDVARILATAIAHPEMPHPKFAELQAKYFPDPGDRFVKQVGTDKICLWLHEYDCMATSPEFASYSLEQWLPDEPGLRNSPGFKRALERLGVPDYWRKHGYPPQCHAVGEKDFSCDPPATNGSAK